MLLGLKSITAVDLTFPPRQRPRSGFRRRFASGVFVSGEIGAKTDGILLPFLQAPEGAEAEHLLADLMCVHAKPVIQQVVTTAFARFSSLDANRRSHKSQDIEDIVAESLLKLLEAVRRLKKSPGGATISDFRGYAAVTAFNTWHGYMRGKRTNRAALKRRLQYLLTVHPDLAIWEGPRRRPLCGFSQWVGTGAVARAGWLNQVRMHPEQLMNGVPVQNPAALLGTIFIRACAPIDFEDLVTLIAEILAITDEPYDQDLGRRRRANSYEPTVEFEDPFKSDGRQLLLKRLWSELLELTPAQRISLLLSFREKGRISGMGLLAEMEIASTAEIGAALGMSADEFARIRPQLPWSDNAISDRLGLSTQQVISCRLTARRRLFRRLISLRDSEEI